MPFRPIDYTADTRFSYGRKLLTHRIRIATLVMDTGSEGPPSRPLRYSFLRCLSMLKGESMNIRTEMLEL